jgi:hypothetical protein
MASTIECPLVYLLQLDFSLRVLIIVFACFSGSLSEILEVKVKQIEFRLEALFNCKLVSVFIFVNVGVPLPCFTM